MWPDVITLPPLDPVVEFVDANLDAIVIGRENGGFDHRGGAIRTFRESPAEFERWQAMLAGQKDSNSGYLDEYFRAYGHLPWEKPALERGDGDGDTQP